MATFIKLTILALGTALLVACQQPVTEKVYPAYTAAEAKTAYTAWNNAYSSSMSLSSGTTAGTTTTTSGNTTVVKSGDDKVTITIVDNSSSASSISIVYTIALNGFMDTSSGYTFNGTMTVTMAMTAASSSFSYKLVGDFDVSGTGPIKKMTFDISTESMFSSSFTGIYKINGKDVDPATL